jgi:hypothetical protein
MDEQRARQTSDDPSAEIVLAAVRRAVRHRAPAPGPAPLWLLREHLAIGPRARGARVLRRRLEELERLGLLARETRHGLPAWSPTPAGEEALAQSDSAAGLPESPRRRDRRRARIAAAQELPRFRVQLSAALAEAERMLAAEPGSEPHAGAWVELGSRLERDCRRVGSAWHCLHEWPDLDDGAPGPAPAEAARLAALRNVRLWREGD